MLGLAAACHGTGHVTRTALCYNFDQRLPRRSTIIDHVTDHVARTTVGRSPVGVIRSLCTGQRYTRPLLLTEQLEIVLDF